MNRPSAPVAKVIPLERERHGDVVVDPYFWMRDRDGDPDVLAYLEAENEYTSAELAHTEDLQETIFQEIKSRIQETDLSVPIRKDGWAYYSRTEEGSQYGISARCTVEALGADESALGPANPDDEQVILDQNVLAEGHDYFSLGVFDVSPSHRILAYATDTTGAETFTLRFRNLDTGEDLDDEVEGIYYGSAWAADNQNLFYTRPDSAMRPYQVWRHTLGTPATSDVLVHTEEDERFFVSVQLGRDAQHVFLHLGSKITDEVRFLDADDPTGVFRTIQPREEGVEYGVEHHRGRFFVVTNADGAENFKLCETDVETPGRDNWVEVMAHRNDVKISGLDAFVDHLVIYERTQAVTQIRVRRLSDGYEHLINQPEEVSTTSGSANPDFNTTTLRYGYQSMVTPGSLFSYDLETADRTLLKQQPVLGDYDSSLYVSERMWARADDGTMVPMSVVRHRDTPQDGNAPAFLYGYGSYEASMDPYFSAVRLSLLDRGFVYAIAHIRGGGEMGRYWYTEGKFLAKKNTFTDFIACARHLVDEGWSKPERIAIRGGSAGGLLMGAVVNMAPDAFGCVVAQVPFVDALNTILDPSLPLTVLEWDEWGNPVESAEYYRYMKSYSPYENVEAKDYPPMLVTAGLNDPRVSYWEPAKWVAKLRTMKTDTNALLLKTEMGAGHMGPSGRYDAWRDEALVLAFILDTFGMGK